MKKLIFKIFLFVFIFVCLVGCKCSNIKERSAIMYGYDYCFNKEQLDSMCVADKINPNIDEWFTTVFYGYQTNEYISKKMYIKQLNETEEIIYFLYEKDSLYLITKRIGRIE